MIFFDIATGDHGIKQQNFTPHRHAQAFMKFVPIILALAFSVLSTTARSQPDDLPTFAILPGQVTEASVAFTADGFRLRMNLALEKRVEFSEFTLRNLDRKVRIIVADKLVQEPMIKARIMGGSMEVIVTSPEEGLAIAKALTAEWPPPTGIGGLFLRYPPLGSAMPHR